METIHIVLSLGLELDIAQLTNSRDKVIIYLGGEFDESGQLIGGVALSDDQYRVLSDIDAIDLKLEGLAVDGSKSLFLLRNPSPDALAISVTKEVKGSH